MGSFPFTGVQAEMLTGEQVRQIVGDDVADRVCARFDATLPDDQGLLGVDLEDDRLAVIQALREISPDAEDPAVQQATDVLLKGLAGTD